MKLLNKKLKPFVTKQDCKNFKKDYHKVKSMYNSLFSKKRMVGFYVVEIFLSLFPPLLFVGLSVAINILTSVYTKNATDVDALIRTADIVFGITSSIFGTLLLSTVISSLITDNEYFEETELRIFSKLKIIRVNSNTYYFVIGFLFYLVAIISKIFESYTNVIGCSIYSLFYFITIFISFVLFKSKTKIDRYVWYLQSIDLFKTKHGTAINSFRKCRALIENSGKEELGNKTIEFFGTSLIYNSDFFNRFNDMIKKLETKASLGVDIKNEQNIIEKYLAHFYSSINNPHNICAFNIMLESYLGLCDRISGSSGVKTETETRTSIINFLNARYCKEFESFLNFKIDFDLNDNYFKFKSFMEYTRMIISVFAIQSFSCLLISTIKAKANSFAGDGTGNKTNVTDNNIERITKRIDAYLNNSKKNTDDLQNYQKKKIDDVTELTKVVSKAINDNGG